MYLCTSQQRCWREFASLALRNDEEVAQTTILEDWRALESAMERIKDNADVVSCAVEHRRAESCVPQT
eukprot:6461359-Amphidinium_carterae.1